MFKIHYRTYQVLDHILVSITKATNMAQEKVVEVDLVLWYELVLQWNYAIISNDLLHTILHDTRMNNKHGVTTKYLLRQQSLTHYH